MRKVTFVLALGLMMLLTTCAFAESTSSFGSFPIHGISVTPTAFSNSSLNYLVSLSSDAYVLAGGVQYAITDIFGFYAVGSKDSSFTATGHALYNGSWNWVDSAKPADLSGWSDNNKDSSITPGTSKIFAFDSLTVSSSAPVMGYHIRIAAVNGVSPFGGGLTGFVIPADVPTPAPVPEPGTILATLSILAPAALMFGRKK